MTDTGDFPVALNRFGLPNIQGHPAMIFIAVVHKDPDSAFGISFPDLPGCFSAADTEDEVLPNAAEALALWLEDRNLDEFATRATLLDSERTYVDDIEAGAYLIEVPYPGTPENPVPDAATPQDDSEGTSHWNYRVMRREDSDDEALHGIHEVYYDGTGKVKGWTEEPVGVIAEADDDKGRNLLATFKRLQRALTEPVLDYNTGKEIGPPIKKAAGKAKKTAPPKAR
jgi:predicted RNase H-like HicB family nuclease